jgi:hypothetical protein
MQLVVLATGDMKAAPGLDFEMVDADGVVLERLTKPFG